MPLLAGVGLLVVCCSSSVAAMMTDPVVPQKIVKKKTPEQIEADKAKAALALVKADPNVTAEEVAAAQLVADNAQAAADADADDADADTVPDPNATANAARAAAALKVAGYDYSKDDMDGIFADTNAQTRNACGTNCRQNQHSKNNKFTCEGFVFRENPKLCRLYDNAQITNVDISDTAYDVYRATGAETGADYTESCDDLGGGVRVRHNSGVVLNSCKKKCRVDASCKGFIHKADTNFCQLHDNNDPYGADVCGAGYRVFRK